MVFLISSRRLLYNLLFNILIQITRVCFFIDGSNLYHGLKAHCGKTNIDFYKLCLKLCGDRQLIRIYYYNAPVNKDDNEEMYKKQQKFFEGLRRTPYLQLTLGRLERRNHVMVEKGVDVFLAIDMLRYAYSGTYDVAVLISSDGDFAGAIHAVKEVGKHVEYVHFKEGVSRHLLDSCDVHTLLTKEFIEDCFHS